MGRGCLLPRFFSRSLLLSIHTSCSFSRFQSLQQCTTSTNRGTVYGVGRRTKQKLTCLPRQDGGSLRSVFTLRENFWHKVTQKVAHHHKQNTLRCHLHTLVCTLPQMYNVLKKHNSTMTRKQIDEPRVSHRVVPLLVQRTTSVVLPDLTTCLKYFVVYTGLISGRIPLLA